MARQAEIKVRIEDLPEFTAAMQQIRSVIEAAWADADRLAHLIGIGHEPRCRPPEGVRLSAWCTVCDALTRHEALVAKR